MRLTLLAIALATPVAVGCDAQRPRTEFDAAAALGYARTQVAFGPRVPGTPAAKRAGDWIVDEMRRRADTVIVQQWTHVTRQGDTLPLRNILARFKPAATERILYLAHWDTPPKATEDPVLGNRASSFEGANDGASGVGLLVAIADLLKKTPPTMGVDLLFVDGEDWGDFAGFEDGDAPDVLIGSRYFAKFPPDSGYSPMFGVLFDMIADSSLNIQQEGHSVARAPEVVRRVWQAAADLGYSEYFVSQQGGAITDDHVPLLNAGLRVIDVIDYSWQLSDGRNYHHTTLDTADKLSLKSMQVVGDVAIKLLRGP